MVRATPADGERSLADLTRPELATDAYDEDAIGPRPDVVATVFRGCRLLPLYGASEIFATSVCWASDPPKMAVISDARPALDGVEVKVVNERGEELPVGEEGEVWYRGPGAMVGYWRDLDRTATAITVGWYHTGI